ncbi:hypothetical protein P171DRAFT_181779 [Karstenula rhodostoma CBS 690.94]|uniref:Uncharacterized protein n=1 Tax=Karstenula rhodostoma CBS 690.94 TaxID=1392251 RepID=A0A9P4P306_9PLEO|nr:hypothetical protein P171DRAFT_181779 [Karstenula rhodostoma CBS 690.94]
MHTVARGAARGRKTWHCGRQRLRLPPQQPLRHQITRHQHRSLFPRQCKKSEVPRGGWGLLRFLALLPRKQSTPVAVVPHVPFLAPVADPSPWLLRRTSLAQLHRGDLNIAWCWNRKFPSRP